MEVISRQSILKKLRALKPELGKLYKVKGLELFGSVARGDHQGKSDIDLMVEFSDGADMFDLIGLNLFLEEKLQNKVDLVPKKTLRSEFQSTVFSEAVVI